MRPRWVDDYPMSVRLMNILQGHPNEGVIRTLDDAIAVGWYSLARRIGMGKKTMKELKELILLETGVDIEPEHLKPKEYTAHEQLTHYLGGPHSL